MGKGTLFIRTCYFFCLLGRLSVFIASFFLCLLYIPRFTLVCPVCPVLSVLYCLSFSLSLSCISCPFFHLALHCVAFAFALPIAHWSERAARNYLYIRIHAHAHLHLHICIYTSASTRTRVHTRIYTCISYADITCFLHTFCKKASFFLYPSFVRSFSFPTYRVFISYVSSSVKRGYLEEFYVKSPP